MVIGFLRNTGTETPKEVIGHLESSCISRELSVPSSVRYADE